MWKMRQALMATLMAAGAALSAFPLAAQEIPRFPIVRFNVAGNTLLPQSVIDEAVAPFIGPKQTFGDVQQALEALEARYRRLGYTTINVILPEQVLERGEVLLNVVEGRLKDIRISGQKYYDEDNIRATLPTLIEGESPIVHDVSANLRIANENPVKNLKLQLKPGDRDEDIHAEIQVTDERPWKVGLTLENTGSIQTGRNRLGFSFQHANLWNRDHILTAQYQTSPEKPNDVKVYALSYRVPLYSIGDAIDFYATQSNVNAGTISLGANSPINLAISGSGVAYGGRYSLNLRRQGNFEHQLVFGLDNKLSQNSIGAGAVQLGNDITTRPLLFQYNGRWQVEASELSWYGGLVRNLPGGEFGDQSDFDRLPRVAPANFSLLRYGLTANHAYTSDWQVRFVLGGQWTNRPLIPGEQFGIGGAGSVRGFQEREIADDKGLQTSFEVYTPELCQPLGGEHRCRALAFVDSGGVYSADREKSREHVASTGLGFRYNLGKQASFQTDYGHVLQGGGSQSRGDWRVHARLGVFF